MCSLLAILVEHNFISNPIPNLNNRLQQIQSHQKNKKTEKQQ